MRGTISKKLSISGGSKYDLVRAFGIVGELRRYEGEVLFVNQNGVYNGKSLMNIIACGLGGGDTVEVVCSGRDEERLLAAAEAMLLWEG